MGDTPAVLCAVSVATTLAYSEWRPIRWRVRDSNGRNYGMFTSNDKASRFANGVLMSLDNDDAYVSIIRERNTNFFVWDGDDIGCSNGRPAIVHLHDEFGSQVCRSVRQVLSMAAMVDAYGLTRVVSALRLLADLVELHPDDLAAWRDHEAEHPVRTGAEDL